MDNRWINPNLLELRFEFLFKTLGKNGKRLSHEARCLALVLILYIPGLITTSITGTVRIFVFEGLGFFLSNILLGVIVWLMIDFLRELDNRIGQISRIVAPTKPKSQNGKEKQKIWEEWTKRKENYIKWTSSLCSAKWYCFDVLGTGLFGLLVGKFLILKRIGWVQNNLLNEVYFLTWITFLGFLAGTILYFVFAGFWVIRRYCKSVVSEVCIRPLDPDHTGGLRELGRLSLDLGLVVALPSLGFLIYLPQNPELLGTEKTRELLMGLSLLYSLLLVLIFFISISPAHDKMKKAKMDSLENIHSEYKDMHEKLLGKLSTKKQLNPVDYKRLNGLYSLYDRVESMAVWPLDYRTLLRFLITSVLPMIASVITVSLW